MPSRMTHTMLKAEVLPLTLALILATPRTVTAGAVTGEIVDARSGRPIPARLYIQADNGRWFLAQAAVPAGSAIPYEK
jgi:hypothetical protein